MTSEADRIARGKVREGDRFAGKVLTELGALEVNAHRDTVDQGRLILIQQIGGKVILQEKESVIAKLMRATNVTEKGKKDIIGISQSKPY